MPPVTPAMLDGRAARWRGHRERRRTEFVTQAVAVIEESGPTVSVDQIARASGVTRQVLYRHFEGRDDLDAAIADRAASMLLEYLADRIDATLVAEDGLRAVIGDYLDFVDAHRSLYWFARSRGAGAPASRAVDRVREDVTRTVAAIAMSVRDDLGLDDPMPVDRVLAVGLVGMADAVVSGWLTDAGDVSREAMIDGLIRLLLGAVRAVLPDE